MCNNLKTFTPAKHYTPELGCTQLSSPLPVDKHAHQDEYTPRPSYLTLAKAPAPLKTV